MVNSITFENFRGLKKLELPELSQITLLTGRNNAGKSSVLEGLFLLKKPSPRSFALLNHLRGMSPALDSVKLWEPSFYNLDAGNLLRISGQVNHKAVFVEYVKNNTFIPADSFDDSSPLYGNIGPKRAVYALKYQFALDKDSEEGNFIPQSNGMSQRTDRTSKRIFDETIQNPNMIFDSGKSTRDSNRLAEWCGQSILNNQKQKIIEIMKLIEPEISDYTTILQQGETRIYIKIGEQLIPLTLAGEGTVRLLEFIFGIMENPACLYLADEIESGFHYSMQKDFWRVLALAAKESNCQIIATTHSYDCIQNAVDGVAEAEMEDQFCLYRLERKGEENRAFRLSGDLLHYSIDANMEVR